MFLHADNDGFRLDANHDQPIDEDDLPTLGTAHRDRAVREAQWRKRASGAEWTEKWWFADAAEIREADFNLGARRYRPQSRATVEHRDPLDILAELKGIEAEIVHEINSLASAVLEVIAE